MNYNSMYDVYQELCAKYPNIPLAYDDSQDCVTVGSDNYSVTAYSNCGQGSVMISDNVLSYQYDSGSLADTERFLSDLVQGKVQFSLAKRGQPAVPPAQGRRFPGPFGLELLNQSAGFAN